MGVSRSASCSRMRDSAYGWENGWEQRMHVSVYVCAPYRMKDEGSSFSGNTLDTTCAMCSSISLVASKGYCRD